MARLGKDFILAAGLTVKSKLSDAVSPDFLGKVGLNLALSLVASCSSCQTA